MPWRTLSERRKRKRRKRCQPPLFMLHYLYATDITSRCWRYGVSLFEPRECTVSNFWKWPRLSFVWVHSCRRGWKVRHEDYCLLPDAKSLASCVVPEAWRWITGLHGLDFKHSYKTLAHAEWDDRPRPFIPRKVQVLCCWKRWTFSHPCEICWTKCLPRQTGRQSGAMEMVQLVDERTRDNGMETNAYRVACGDAGRLSDLAQWIYKRRWNGFNSPIN